MTNYVISPEAEIDLQEIFNFTVEEWGDTQAEKYLYEIYAVFDRLAVRPMIGRMRPELAEELRSIPCGAHIIFFMMWSDEVAIVRVLHGSRDVENLF